MCGVALLVSGGVSIVPSVGCNDLVGIERPSAIVPDAGAAAVADGGAADAPEGGVAVARTAWNLSNDFSSIQNPNGDWAYGYLTADIRTQVLCGVPRGAGQLTGWSLLKHENPSVLHNPTSVEQDLGTNPLEAVPFASGRTAFHPGEFGQPAVVRWTAPRGGFYRIGAQLFAMDDKGSEVVTVRRNGVGVASAEFRKGAAPDTRATSYAFTGCLNACETFDMVLGLQGATESYEYRSNTTAVDVTIALDSASPDEACPDSLPDGGACPAACLVP